MVLVYQSVLKGTKFWTNFKSDRILFEEQNTVTLKICSEFVLFIKRTLFMKFSTLLVEKLNSAHSTDTWDHSFSSISFATRDNNVDVSCKLF